MAPEITTLFLDVGGVLLTNGWDRTGRHAAAQTFGLDLTELDERHHLTFDTYEEGKLSLDSYLERVVFHTPRPFSRDDFRRFMFARSQPLPGMIELVTQLKKRHNLRITVVSNEGRELTEHRIRTFGLNAFVDSFVASCFVHIRKPDTDIYTLALDVSQARPQEVAYIDDRAMFVEVARSLQITGILHTDLNSTRLKLAELGLS
ncbi:MAG: HAD family hydrolase [Acidobacteriota bacterium]